ncbi:MAG: heparinase II/III family protein [Planctomycetota bacterium]
MNLPRLYRTVRHLQRRQIVGQVWQRVQRRIESPARFAERAVPDFPGCAWSPRAGILPPPQHNNAEHIKAGRFEFVNDPREIGWPPDWEISEAPKLWQYNLHYFEWLWALDYADARAAVLDWIERHDLQRGRVGWEPYPTSLRLMNWCGVFFEKHRGKVESDTDFLSALWPSIFLQTEWLSRHLETHLLGNHYFENGAALASVGACFRGPDADRWVRTGLDILSEQIPEQILPDGMHFERSPMYHCRMVYLMLLLANVGRPEVRDLAERSLPGMLRALDFVCHPDGQIALFNDSAFGIYNQPADLFAAAEKLIDPDSMPRRNGAGPWALLHAGYYGWRGGDGVYLICDAGPIGPDYIPGHAHGDIFSFELSVKGQRVIVDSGVHSYESGPMRDYCRSTRAHNTVEIDGRDQAEFWGAFRVGRRGKPELLERATVNDRLKVRASHGGYRHSMPRAVHERSFLFDPPDDLVIKDNIQAEETVHTMSRIHVHPDCSVRMMGESFEVDFPGGRLCLEFSGADRTAQEQSYYCPEFGLKHDNTVLFAENHGMDVKTQLRIATH